jgi:predicted DNA-binding transcriptional regulator YafY
MKKAERLNWIIMTLKQRGKMTAAELARYMEVSPRTIYRDMTALGEIRVPVTVQEGADGGYEIDPSYFLPTIRLNDREILVLLMLLKFAEQLHMEEFLGGIRTLGHKLLEICRGDSERLRSAIARIRFDMGAVLPERYPEGIFSLMIEAFADRRRLRLAYFTPLRGELSEREVTPHELVYADGCWYLCAHCHRRHEQRTFRLDRIRSACLLQEEALAGPPDAPPGEPLQEILLEMDPRLFDLVEADEAMRGADVTPLAGGRLEVRLVRRRLDYFEHLAFRNVEQVTVKSPPALVASIRAKLSLGIRKYGVPR